MDALMTRVTQVHDAEPEFSKVGRPWRKIPRGAAMTTTRKKRRRRLTEAAIIEQERGWLT